jgi:tetratricopeptide (TPR) repeat protein
VTSPVQRAAALLEASPASAMRLLAPHLAAEPDDWYALCLAAQALIALGDCQRSLELSRRAAQLNPSDDWPARLQAIAHRNAGHTFDAPRIARHSVLINPANWQTHFLVASTDLWAEAATWQSMLAAEKARELAPDEPSTHNLVGQLALALGKSRLAVRSFEQALRLDPENSIAQHELARAHLRRFRIGKSLLGFLAVGRLDPSLPQTRINLHAIATRAVQLLHYAILVACVLNPFSAQASAGLVLVIVLGALTWARHRGGPALLRFVAGIPRRDPLLVAWAGLLLLAGALLVLRGVLTIGRPAGTAADSGLTGAAFALIVAGVVTTWIRRIHYKPSYSDEPGKQPLRPPRSTGR